MKKKRKPPYLCLFKFIFFFLRGVLVCQSRSSFNIRPISWLCRGCCLHLKVRKHHTFKNSSQSCVFAKYRRLVFPSGIPNEQDLARRREQWA